MIIIGDSTVGKTSIIGRILKNSFDSTQHEPTIGVAFQHTSKTIDGKEYRIELYDTAGQERFTSLVPMYYKRAQFCFIVFDLTNEASFDRVEFWEKELKAAKNTDNKNIQRVVVGNKLDLNQKITVDEAEVRKWCET